MLKAGQLSNNIKVIYKGQLPYALHRLDDRWKVCAHTRELKKEFPAGEYILALKITAGRQKDLDDCAILLPKTQIRTRKQAQQVLEQYILPEGQQKHAERIENALNQLFGREG